MDLLILNALKKSDSQLRKGIKNERAGADILAFTAGLSTLEPNATKAN